MTTTEYMNKQNLIVSNYTDRILIPEKQILDIPVTVKMLENLEVYMATLSNVKTGRKVAAAINAGNILNSNNSLYCATYLSISDCRGCPIYEANNDCADLDSTYRQCYLDTGFLSRKSIRAMQEELVKLANDFLEAHSYLLEEN